MVVVAEVLNGTNNDHDYGFQRGTSALFGDAGGILKGYGNEAAVTTNQVDTGLVFVPATRTTISPNETFLVPVEIRAAQVVDTSGDGYIVVQLDSSKVNDGSSNNADGTGIATVGKVGSLPSSNYVLLATLVGGVITNNNNWAQINSNIQPDGFAYDEDAEASDAYAITLTHVYELVDGEEYAFKANTSNTDAATLQINSLGAKAIKRSGDQDIVTDDIKAGQIVVVRYDADNDWFQMTSQLGQQPVTLALANTAEAEAGTNDEKYMSPLKVREAIKYFHESDVEFGEDIDGSTVAIPVRIMGDNFCKVLKNHSTVFPAQPSGSSAVGEQDTNTRRSVTVNVDDDRIVELKLVEAYVPLEKFGSPSGNAILEAVEDDGGGDPTDTVYTNGTSNNVSETGLPVNGASWRKFTWSTPPVVPSDGTDWHIVLRRDVANNASNYIGVTTTGSPVDLPDGKVYTASTEVWGNSTEMMMILVFEVDYGGKAYKSDASSSDPDLADVNGFVTGNWTSGQTGRVQTSGIIRGFNNTLDPGKTQFLDDSAGVIIDDQSSLPTPHMIRVGHSNNDDDLQMNVDRMYYATIADNINVTETNASVNGTGTGFIHTGFRPRMIELSYRGVEGGTNTQFLTVAASLEQNDIGVISLDALDGVFRVLNATSKVEMDANQYLVAYQVFENGVLLSISGNEQLTIYDTQIRITG